MSIAIIGAGNVGAALARRWIAAGRSVSIGVRDPNAERAEHLAAELGDRASIASVTEAARSASAIVLAVPWAGALDAVRACGPLTGKIVIDPINSFTPTLDLSVRGDTSVAEEIARAAAGAHVFKAFNTLGAGNFADLNFEGQRPSGFFCGDDAPSRGEVVRLIEDVGLAALDCGPLQNARLLESVALLWGRLAFGLGYGPEIAFALLKRGHGG